MRLYSKGQFEFGLIALGSDLSARYDQELLSEIRLCQKVLVMSL